MSELAVKPWRTVRAPVADRPQLRVPTPPETNIVSGTTLRLACGPSAPQERTVRSLTLKPTPETPFLVQKLKYSSGPSAHLGRTVRQPTRASASSLERSRTVRPSGPDSPPAHQSLCKLSGTGADCPPLRCGLSAVTQ